MARWIITGVVLEPSADGGDLKTGRKGCGTFEVVIEGRAAHAGLEPGTKVALKYGDSKGTITIHYYSDEELNALLDQFLPEE